jgi:LEA14-like dessication related protein
VTKHRFALLAGLALVLTTSCPGITKPLEKPSVSLQSVSVTGVSLAGLDARASLSIMNPNAIGLPLRAFDWELSIGGASPVRGRATLSENIPAKGTAPVVVDLHVSAAAAVETSTAIASGANDFRLAGTLHFETRLGDIAVSFDESGSLAELPR